MGHKLVGACLIGLGMISIFYPILCQYIEQKEVDFHISHIIQYGAFPSFNSEVADGLESYSEYLGYIWFPDYGVRRLIVGGTSSSFLDQGYVGMFSTSIALDEEVGNVILAGHSISSVFECLHTILIGSQVVIGFGQDIEVYEVLDKWVISDHDFSYFNNIGEGKFLTLVTCMHDNHKRLIVRARKVEA